MTRVGPRADPHAEAAALRLSMAGGVAFAVLGITVGMATGSSIILFDGFYAFVGIGLAWMALKAARLVGAGPTTTFPFGREGLTPLVVGFEGVALLATCGYASVEAVVTIAGGGGGVAGGWEMSYATVSFVVPVAVALRLRRVRDSELVAAEATQWTAGAAPGLGLLAAFALARALDGTGWAAAAVYVDPVLVLAAAAVFAVPPVRMVRTTLRELLEGAPAETVRAPVQRAVDEARQRFGLAAPYLRMSKLGPKLYVELDFVVEEAWTVRQADEVRHDLVDRLGPLPLDVWMSVEFSADPDWGR